MSSFGDLGYHVIFHAVLEYFPALTIDTDYAPLSHARLIKEVLVPEAMVSLISEELGVNHEEAIEIMETSAEFGLYHHSDIHDRLRSGSSIRPSVGPRPATFATARLPILGLPPSLSASFTRCFSRQVEASQLGRYDL